MSRNIKMYVPANRQKNKETDEQKKKHRQKLLKRARQAQENRLKRPSSSSKNKKKDPNKQATRLKQQYQKIQQQIAAQEQKSNRQEQKYLKQIARLKKDNHQLRLQLQKSKLEIDNRERSLEDKERKWQYQYVSQKNELASMRDRLTEIGWDPEKGPKLSEFYEEKEKTFLWLTEIFMRSAKSFVEQRQSYADTRQKMKEVQRDCNDYKKQLKQANEENDHLRHKIKTQNDKIEGYEDRYRSNNRAEALLMHLIDNLDSDTLGQYSKLGELNQKFNDIFAKTVEQQDFQGQVIYGYLKIVNGRYYIVSVSSQEQHELDVMEVQEKDKLFVNRAAIKAQSEPRTPRYQLIRIYETISLNSTDEIKKAIRKRSKKVKETHVDKSSATPVNDAVEIVNPDKLAWLKQLTITVVGNKRVDPFVEEMRKYVKVRKFDGYEDQEKLIFKAINSSDYTFILIDSVPHSITDFTKHHEDLMPGSGRVQIFRNPNRYSGVMRLNYLYENENY